MLVATRRWVDLVRIWVGQCRWQGRRVGTGGDGAEEGVVVEQINSTLLFSGPLLFLHAAKTSIAIYPRRFGFEFWHRTG
jgi:hypothetical protein